MKALQKFTGLAVLLALIINVFLPVAVLAEGLTAEINAPVSGEHFDLGEPIAFSGNTTGGNAPFSYVWLFGDNTSALSQDYSKSYTESGDYTVTFKVTDASGAQSEATVNITVDNEEETGPNPPAALDGRVGFPNNGDQFNVGEPIEFQATVTGGNAPFSYVWNFDDGTSALSQTYLKTYSAAGNYVVIIEVVDASGTHSSDSVSLTIVESNNENDLSVSVSNPTNNAQLTVNQATNFSAAVTGGNAPFSYVWLFGDNTSALSQDYNKAYAQTGNYHVILTVTDANGYTDTDSIEVSVIMNGNGGGGDNESELEVSNIRVTDITQTSAIVRWNTNLTASSRVIYDTSSHLSLGNAPNYGYANSTETFDASTGVTEHAVTLTSLSPATTYYFRVISVR